MAQLVCNHSACDEQAEHLQSHSLLIVLQKVDKAGYTYFQCEDGQEVNFLNWQHFHCSHEHMKAALPDCINEHYAEEHLHGPIMGTTILHKIVLGSHLQCTVCQSPLTEQAYRFCLTRATPYNELVNDFHNELGEWCCSLEHAKQSALVTIAAIAE